MVNQLNYDLLSKHYTPFLSSRVSRRKFLAFWDEDLPKGIKVHPNPIELAAGMPHEGLFPIESIHLNIVRSPFHHLTYQTKYEKIHGLQAVTDPFNEKEFIKEKVDSDHMVDIWRYDPKNKENISLSQALQYTDTKGMESLLTLTKQIIEKINPPAYENWDILLANGSSDGLFKIFETISDENVTVMLEEFTFTPTISNITATGGNVIPLKINITHDLETQGIDVDYLSDLLENWYTGPYKHLSRPRVLYTIPTGQNPTGMTQSFHKRKLIYKLAEKYDFLIIEDDPYGYLKLPCIDIQNPWKNPYKDNEYTRDEYCNNILPKSYLTIDTSGRVIRLETFSKVFAPGLRLSFIVANNFFIKKLLDLSEITTRAPNGVSQAIVNNIVNYWGEAFDNKIYGWIDWVMKLAGEYTQRRNILFQALIRTSAYNKRLFNIIEPSAGMFMTIEICLDKLLNLKKEDKLKAMNFLNYKLLEEGFICVIAYKMAVSIDFSYSRAHFLRLTFAYAANEDEINEASLRFSKGVERLFVEYEK